MLSIFAFQYTQQRYNVIATSLYDVALKLSYCCDGNIKLSCKSDVIATSHYGISQRDVATTSLLKRRQTFPSQLYGNFRATSNSDVLHYFCEIKKEVINPSYVEADKKFDLEFQPATCTWYSVNNNELNGKKIEMYTSSTLISENLSNKYF